jgi:cell division protein FtsB
MDKPKLAQGMMVRVGMAVFGLLTLATLVLALVSERGLLSVREKGRELAALEQQIEDLEAENTALIDEIRSLRSDPAEIERRAREELKLVRPGEVVLTLPPEETDSR